MAVEAWLNHVVVVRSILLEWMAVKLITLEFEICLEGFRLEGLNCSFDRDLMAQLMNVRLAYLEKLLMEYDEY